MRSRIDVPSHFDLRANRDLPKHDLALTTSCMCCRLLIPIERHGPTDQAGKALAPRALGLFTFDSRRLHALPLLVGFGRADPNNIPIPFHWRPLAQICAGI